MYEPDVFEGKRVVGTWQRDTFPVPFLFGKAVPYAIRNAHAMKHNRPLDLDGATDPNWTERRLVPLAPHTLEQLEQLAKALSQAATPPIGPLQVAALLLEHALTQVDADMLEDRARRLRRG